MSGSGQGWFDEVKDFSRITECCIRSLELEQLFDICLIEFVKIFDLCFIDSYHCISVILLFNYMRSWRGGGDAALLRLGYSLQMTQA